MPEISKNNLISSNTHRTFHVSGDRRYLTFPRLDEYPELKHLFTTRHGGISTGCCSTWNLGERNLDTDENILQNYLILADTLGIPADRFVRTQQTHTSNIMIVSEADHGKGITKDRDYTDVDGLVTDVRNLAIVTTHADCNAVFFFDPAKQVIGLAHSGWKGTLKGISKEMIRIMSESFNCNPEDIIAGTGPALCQDCFEVDRDVRELFLAKDEDYIRFMYDRGIKTYIDLKAIIRYDLMDMGLNENNLLDMDLCTKCYKDEFFSHRGHQGKRGLMAAVMALV